MVLLKDGDGMNSWAGVVKTFALAAILFGVAYITLSSLNLLPQSMKDFVVFLSDHMPTFAFVFCFTTGAYVFLRILQTRRGEHR